MDLSVIPWLDLTPAGLVLVAVMMVFTGLLVPRWSVLRSERLLQQLADERGKEATAWRTAFEASEQARTEQSAQLSTLLESSRTTVDLLRAISKVGAP